MAGIQAIAGQIWRDDCYYFDSATGQCKRKYVLVLAVEPKSGDCVTAVLTSKPNGLTDNPPCHLGPPRAGYFVGTPGGRLTLPTWIDFSSVQILDCDDLVIHVKTGRKQLHLQTLSKVTFCAVLRCVLQCEDISLREARWVADSVALLGCP